jgi:hypothetical protein
MKTATRKLCCLGTLLAAATVVAITSALPGCNGRPATVEPAADGTVSEFGCSEKLDSALEMLRPERLGISTDAEAAELRLNTWLKDCGQEVEVAGPLGPEIEQLLQPILSQTQMKRLTAGRFVAGDAEHIRNCQLHKAMANLDLGAQESELEHAVALFHFCIRNIALHASADERLPLTSYEILLFGRGDPQDIAWVYADVLRQLQIDAVIIRPATATANSTAEDSTAEESAVGNNTADDLWLIGVLLNEEVYLFDPRLGTPIPAATDTGLTATVQQPATLSDVLNDDSLLRKLDLADGQPYPFTAKMLQQVTVEVVGTRSLWTSSMQRLDTSLTGDWSSLVFDGLQDGTKSPGLVSRVAEYGGENWGKDDIGIWPYPEQQPAAVQHRSEVQRKRFSNLELSLDAPVPVELDLAAQQIHTGTPEKRCLKARISHLLGDYDTAVPNYQKLRIRLIGASRLPLPAEIRTIHERAEDDAAYWIGLCQFDKGNFVSAISTFRDYLRRYAQQPNAAWTVHCRFMLALSLAEDTADWSEAIFELQDELEDEDTPEPLAARRRFCIKRWKAAQEMAKK